MTRGRRLSRHAWLLVGLFGISGGIMFYTNIWLLGDPAMARALGPGAEWASYGRLAFSLVLLAAAGYFAIWLQRAVLGPLTTVRGILHALREGKYDPEIALPPEAAQELQAVGADLADVAARLRENQARVEASTRATRQAFDAMTAAFGDAVELNRRATHLNEALARQKAAVEGEVARRTEELQLANEELTAQAEELTSQADELAGQAAKLEAANDQLQQVDRMKDQFLAILSHELRTPLNAVVGFASMLDDEVAGALNPTQHAFLAKILGGTEVLLGLINDLLDMSRIQAGKFSLAPERRAPTPVLADTLAILAPLAERGGIQLVLAADEGLPALTFDPQRVHQVLLNLVGNAIKFTPRGGRVEVRARVDGGSLRVEVADTGPGIAPADQARLFKPFTQLDMSNTRQARGTGLGLSIVKALVEAHGGAVGLESRVGAGSTFWFTLPLEGVSPPA